MKSKTLLVAMLQESGHMNPSFKLLRTLQKRGHDVRYLATPAMVEHVRGHGFEVVPFFPEIFAAPSAGNLLERRRAITAQYRALNERLLQEGAHAFGVKPDLALIDVTQTAVALWARLFRVPTVLINTSLPQTKDRGVPPLRSSAAYGDHALGSARAELLWRRFLAKRRLSARLADLLGMCPPYAMASRLAPRFGVDPAELDADTMYMPQLKGLPELVLCPPQLDFPRPARAERHYVESLDEQRQESDFDFSRVENAKPLVYCALGSQVYRGADTPRFLKRVVEAFAQRPALQLVLATGKHIAPEALGPLPSNVLVLARAPQLGMLARAQLMITHAGLGSVKECVSHAVPMLAFPLDVDQPGNAARIVHHGLGLRGDVRRTSTAELLGMLDRVLGDASFAACAQAMQRVVREHEAQHTGADLLERLLSAPSMVTDTTRPA